MGARANILLTGGAGFIGSHIAVELAHAGCTPILLDNFCNSEPSVVARISELAGRPIDCIQADVCDADALDRAFGTHAVNAVIHLAALKAVGESVEQPERYYDNNVIGSRALLGAMARAGVHRLVFSSSCTVYGHPERLPIDETHPIRAINPYGETKVQVERMIGEWTAAHTDRHACSLRYFNPVGAHPSALIGESPRGIPNNLFPFVVRVAMGESSDVGVFGNDYPTRDGTGVRDYIHVVDLALGHLAALRALGGMTHAAINLGTGHGTSVLEVLDAFERVNGVRIPRRMLARRPGDAAEAWADPRLAARVLDWTATRGIDEMVRDSYAYAKRVMSEPRQASESHDPSG